MDRYMYTCILVLWLGLRHPVSSWRDSILHWMGRVEGEEGNMGGRGNNMLLAQMELLVPCSSVRPPYCFSLPLGKRPLGSQPDLMFGRQVRVHLGLKEVGVELLLNFRVLLS